MDDYDRCIRTTKLCNTKFQSFQLYIECTNQVIKNIKYNKKCLTNIKPKIILDSSDIKVEIESPTLVAIKKQRRIKESEERLTLMVQKQFTLREKIERGLHKTFK